jgi:hypothetical protein
MHLHMAAIAVDSNSAHALLGRDHPLARILEQMTVRVEGAAIVAAILSGAVAALASGVDHALAVVLASVVAEVALIGSVALLASDCRAHIRDLIIEGRGALPLEVVQRERRRLMARDTRAALARSLATLAHRAERETVHASYPPPVYAPRIVAAAGPELWAIAGLLDGDGGGVAGVGLTERLLAGDGSPLYGRDVEALRCELRRIAFTLSAPRELPSVASPAG